jgi:HEAT repeat protein
LLDRLDDPDPIRRRRVAGELADAAGPDPSPPLLSALADRARREEDPGTRTHLVEAATRAPRTESAGVILWALADPDTEVRALAARRAAGFCPFGHEGIVSGLTVCLTDESDIVRAAAAQALGEANAVEATGALRGLLADRSLDARIAAATALGRVGSADGVGVLLRALATEGRQTRISAIEGLAYSGSQRAIRPLIDVVADEGMSVELRRRAASALEAITGRHAPWPGTADREGRQAYASDWRTWSETRATQSIRGEDR